MSVKPTPVGYLEQLSASQPAAIAHTSAMAELHTKKLWHQLTLKVLEYIKTPEANQGTHLMDFYNNFVKTFEMNISQLNLSQIVVACSRKIADHDAAMEFLNGIADRLKGKEEVVKRILHTDAYVFTRIEVAVRLCQKGELQKAKDIIDDNKDLLDKTAGIDSSIHSVHYQVAAHYHKLKNEPTEYYRSSLLYLAYTPLEAMDPADRLNTAAMLGLAGLLGEDIYNFGELLAHPVVKLLEQSEWEWLYHLLMVFNGGKISEYDAHLQKYGAQIQSHPDLVAKADFLREKLQILALMELVFHRSNNDRCLSFKEIADATMAPVDQVEFLAMKALSYHVIDGIIDQVDQTVTVTRVQPRVLDMNQVSSMKTRLGSWCTQVHETLNFLESETPELFV
eukprot:GFYU01002036.1.p1 GENE.GFYU01002036.1~~GFYU01002036.1.p1  ORF type:complete len:394 (-),score=146.75 GFYU01002036.1:295-1476(-)